MKDRLYLLVIICLYAIINLPFLTIFPPIDNVGDESWMMNISLELLRTGRPVASMHAGTPISETVQITTMWIYSGALSGVFYIFGPSVWAGRFLSFLCGLSVVILTYLFGKNIGNRKIGLMASFLLTTSIAFSWHTREMRPEMMLLAFSTLSVYLFYRAWQERKDIFLLLSGLLSTMSVQVHPNGAIFAFAILLIYSVLYRKSLLSRPSLFLIFGLFTGFAIWLVFNYLPYSPSSFETIHKKYLPPVINEDFYVLLTNGIQRFTGAFSPWHLNWLRVKYFSGINIAFAYLALLLIFASLLFRRKRKQLIFLLSFIALPLGISTFLISAWNWFHYSVFLALCFIALSISIYDIVEMLPWRRFKMLLLYGVVLVFGGAGIIDIMKRDIDMMEYDFNAVKKEISRSVPAGATVMGSPLYYFAFLEKSNNRFMTYLFVEEKCPDFESAIRTHKIDYIFVDDILINLTAMWCSPAYSNKIREYLMKNTSLVSIIDVEYPNSHASNRLLRRVYLMRINQ